MSERKVPVAVEYVVVAELGKEHLANAAFRRGIGGEGVTAWGGRLLEWPADLSGGPAEVVPPEGNLDYSNGGCAMDVDGDGVEEIVVARGEGREQINPELLWFKEVPGQPVWQAHPIGRTGSGSFSAPHDFVPIEVTLPSGEVRRGVVVVVSRQDLAWYEIPEDPTRPWVPHEIARLPDKGQSGMAVGDFAGNGRPDVACGMFWAECPADPTREAWIVRRYGPWNESDFAGMDKIVAGDMDGDGRLELVVSEAEIPEARMGIFKRDPKVPEGLWTYTELDRGLYCPHSVVVCDLDGDGRPDVVAGEMTAGGWSFPMNPNPRMFGYLNRGNGRFDRIVLHEGRGMHEVKVAPHRFGRRALLYGADEIQRHKFPEMETHVSFWWITPGE